MKNILKNRRIMLGLLVSMILPSLIFIESINSYFSGKSVFNISYALETSELEEQENTLAVEEESTEETPPTLEESLKATFSFDGANAGSIVIDSTKEDLKWEYSIDGGKTWKTANTLIHKLDKYELDIINQTDDIQVREEKTLKSTIIDILKGEEPTLYNNDFENTLIGNTKGFEWRYVTTDGWISFDTNKPVLTGNIAVMVRKKATGLHLAGEPKTYEFTQNVNSDVKKYIPISRLKIEESSSNNGKNAIDGNRNTSWSTNIKDNFIIIKVDKAFYLSSLEFMSELNNKDGIKSFRLYTSMNGKEWELVKKYEFENTDTLKETILDTSIQAQYIKIVVDESYSENDLAAIAFINVYEDTTKKLVPYVDIEYDITRPTNGSVIAKLVNPTVDITVTSEGGDTHEFTEDGEWTFTFVDKDGTTGLRVAKVNWIDKIIPTATLEYDIKNPTIKDVTVTIKPSEDVTVTNNDGKLSHTFKDNGTFKFEFVDRAGNKGEIESKVDWIDREAPIGLIQYSTIEKTTGAVMATLRANEDIIVVNNDGKNSHVFEKNGTFEFVYKDLAGNTANIFAKVDWIEEKASKPSAPTTTKRPSFKNNKTSKRTTTKKPETEKTLSVDNISLSIPSKSIKGAVTLSKDKIELTKGLKAKVGNESEYFEIYAKDKNDKRVNINTIMKMTIDLDSDKSFLGFYKVKEEDSVENIEYKTVSSNKIEVEIDTLGEYIISYEKIEEKEIKNKKNNNLIVTIIILVLMIIAGIIVYKKTREEK